MKNYYIKSLIGEVADGIKRLAAQDVISKEQKILLYGLSRYSFAMRTILSNLGYHNIEGYISFDEKEVIDHNQTIKNFACRYLNSADSLINVYSAGERLGKFDDSVRILIAENTYQEQRDRLTELGYVENKHFYKVCDFKDEETDALCAKKERMSLDEIKNTEKNILMFVDDFCRENNIRYWVCGGTLLGTVRHKGFIPWDDDIDIFMPLCDYMRFIDLFSEDDRYAVTGFGTSDGVGFYDVFSKVVDKRTLVIEDKGTIKRVTPLWIDVFPLIGLPENTEERHMFFSEYQELNRKIWEDFYKENGNIEVFSKWASKQKEFITKYEFDSSEYVGVLGTVYGERDCTGRSVYESTLYLPFEDITVRVPAGYEEYLENLYGDWMKLPPKDRRVSHHGVEVYRL